MRYLHLTFKKYPIELNCALKYLAVHLYHPLCSCLIAEKLRYPSWDWTTGGGPSSFSHIAVETGLASTSHLSETGIPSNMGMPKPGSREMANDGVSETE